MSAISPGGIRNVSPSIFNAVSLQSFSCELATGDVGHKAIKCPFVYAASSAFFAEEMLQIGGAIGPLGEDSDGLVGKTGY